MFWGRSEELRRRARKQERKNPDIDRRERHNERHRRYRARHREQEEERNKGSFWFCGKKPSCGFLCKEEDGYLFQIALTTWRAMGLTQPICESHRKPAKFRVVKDMLKKSYGRPYFTCASRENPCSLWMWAEEKEAEKPNCYHNKPCAVKRVKKQGPNTGKKFFCCCNKNRCDYFEWGPEELPKQPDTMAPFVPLFYNRYYPDAQQN
ncbi:endonuclease 8-like 3 isoform X2 [Paramuricea clavata]|uniref:Endonuclease 8-like 3 isoform X2 n=1 Tax=Paramuricea clavata TaxID=317549 RepID=A0A6S7HMF3_PARCT|nr:endonuclease 8-like 3 isoform X2 [Paramuricea clavata]